jgi:hypothetical protein
MILLVTGVAIFLLLVASYSRHRAWIAWCSTTMSAAAFLGLLLIPTFTDAGKARAGLNRLFRQLPLVLNRETLSDLTAAITQSSTAAICDVGCGPKVGHKVSPIAQNAMVPQTSVSPEVSEGNRAGATATQLAANSDAADAVGSPIMWLLDRGGAASGNGSRQFIMTGINVSDVTLKRVHATLKLDTSQRELALALKVNGDKFDETNAIPAGTGFTLRLEAKTTRSKQLVGGAIFAFRYTYAGRQRATIWYLNPDVIARLAQIE